MEGRGLFVRSFYSELRVQPVCVVLNPMGHHLLRESFPPLTLDDGHLPEHCILTLFPNTVYRNTLCPHKEAQVFSSPAIEKQASFVFFGIPEEKSAVLLLDD